MTTEKLDIDELNTTLDSAIEYLQNIRRNLNQIGVGKVHIYLESGYDDNDDPIIDFYIGYDEQEKSPNKIFDFNDIDTRESKF